MNGSDWECARLPDAMGSHGDVDHRIAQRRSPLLQQGIHPPLVVASALPWWEAPVPSRPKCPSFCSQVRQNRQRLSVHAGPH
eukprot:13479701-Alexandrium_andersonii.AAC.1